MTNKDELLPCREAFEKWVVEAKLQTGRSFDLETKDNGSYLYPTIQTAWEAWQAAWNTRAQPQNVETNTEQSVVDGFLDQLSVVSRAFEKLENEQPSGDVKAALDALYWIVTNGQFTEEQTEQLTASLRAVERVLTARQPDVNQELLEALQCLWDLHLDATGKKKRDSQLDIDDYYNAVERKVKQAIARAEQKGGK